MTRKPETPRTEARRLARVAELARIARRHERALERAMKAAMDRGIGVRRIADAAGVSHSTVWRLARTGAGQPGLGRKDVTLPNRLDKPETRTK